MKKTILIGMLILLASLTYAYEVLQEETVCHDETVRGIREICSEGYCVNKSVWLGNYTTICQLENVTYYYPDNIMGNQTMEGDYLFTGDVYIHGNISGASPLSISSEVELTGFDFEGFKFLKDIFNRIKEVLTNQNTRVSTIEQDLCNMGYNKYC